MPGDDKIKRNVFLDTQVIISNNFQFFTNENLSRMIKHTKEDRLSIYFTQITIDEIKTNIIDTINEAEKAIRSKQFRRSISILYNSNKNPSFKEILRGFDSETIQEEILGQFDQS